MNQPSITELSQPSEPMPSEHSHPASRYDYERDGAEIYRRSFATIRAEAELGRFRDEREGRDLERVVVRMIHACGMVDLAGDVEASVGAMTTARQALLAGAPILCDAQMVASGVTRRRLPANNEVLCALGYPGVADLANRLGTTRSAAALQLFGAALEGSVVAIGNAPTALFHLLELIAAGGPRPAAILGLPVGFIGSAESKRALADNPFALPYLVVHGRRGGSAMAVAAINALASEAE